jgi:hypothetical protein
LEQKILQAIDSLYEDYLLRKIDIESFERRMGKTLSALPLKNRKNFTVSIVNNNHKEPFFGLRIFPIIKELNMVANEIINDKIGFRQLIRKWESIEDWYIEIDAQVFLRSEINFTPKELTAMTIHEIGHSIYSEKKLVVMYNAFKESQMRMKLADKASMKVLYSLYMIPLSVSCAQKGYIDRNSIKTEYFADSVLKNYGYSDALISALNKIIKTYGNNSASNKSQNIEQSITWCNVNVSDLARRKDKLKDELFYQSLKSESNYFKAVCIKVLNELGVKMREKYTGAVVECTLDMLQSDYTYGDDCKPLFEAFQPFIEIEKGAQLDRRYNMCRNGVNIDAAVESLFKRNNRPIKLELPTNQDIDEIMIEIDKITSHRDRMFVLDLIYYNLEKIDVYEEAKGSSISSLNRGKIEDLRKSLEQLRQAVLNKKIKEKEYKFFIKYPEGYEG